MDHRIVVCTDHSVTWECLRRFSASAPVTLERVTRLEDLSGRDGLAVDAVVVDDRFLPIIAQVQRSARRHSPIFGHALFMTAGEALNALWNGPLGGADNCSAGDLSDWVTLARGGEVDDLPF